MTSRRSSASNCSTSRPLTTSSLHHSQQQQHQHHSRSSSSSSALPRSLTISTPSSPTAAALVNADVAPVGCGTTASPPREPHRNLLTHEQGVSCDVTEGAATYSPQVERKK